MDEANEAYEERLEDARQKRRSEQEANKKDNERLNWLALHPRGAKILVDGVPQDCLFYGLALAPGVDLRSGIDAAMNGANYALNRPKAE